MGEAAATDPARVLVVDDSSLNRLTLQRGVENEGHQVVAVENGRKALEVMRSEPVDTVLLDLEMPEMDGFEVLAEMQRDPALNEIPVLVISGVEEISQVARAIELGAIDVLPKPFEPVLLRARLRTSLQQRRLRAVEQRYLRQELVLRQQEKLVTLGKLSAGLAHEINNPAAAALRSARRLPELFDSLFAADADGGLRLKLDPVSAPPIGSLELADREAEISGVLTGHRLDRVWDLAPELAAAGATAEGLGRALADADPTTSQAALERLCVRSAARSAVSQIVTSVERISETIGALRRYSYLDRAATGPVDVRIGLDDTIAILSHKIPPGVTVHREYATDLPLVDGDSGQLDQVWTNLIDNAVQVLGEHGRLVVRARPDDAGVVVEVEDDGPGIPDDLQGSVFDPFVTSKEPGEGLGLGLNLAHQVITDGHRGRITMNSAPGRTVFVVRLPQHDEGGSPNDDD